MTKSKKIKAIQYTHGLTRLLASFIKQYNTNLIGQIMKSTMRYYIMVYNPIIWQRRSDNNYDGMSRARRCHKARQSLFITTRHVRGCGKQSIKYMIQESQLSGAACNVSAKNGMLICMIFKRVIHNVNATCINSRTLNIIFGFVKYLSQ